MNEAQRTRIADGVGFIAALDQSGGSTPEALQQYGVARSEFAADDDDRMFELMHEFRTRIITSPSFTGDRVLGAILFEQTMHRYVDGALTAEYLWLHKNVVPFVKVDEGLAAQAHGTRMMKPLPRFDDLLARATAHKIFGTKMRSFITKANASGIDAVLDQQFHYATASSTLASCRSSNLRWTSRALTRPRQNNCSWTASPNGWRRCRATGRSC
jgi:fructose-bisphosphate aldolase, class I